MKFPSIRKPSGALGATLLFPLFLVMLLYYPAPWYVQGFNLLLLFAVYGLFLLLTQRIKPSMIVIAILMAALSVGNEFSISVRSVAFQFTDFFCALDAMRLSGRYSFSITPGMIWAVLASGGLLTIFLVLLRDYHDGEHGKMPFRTGAAALLLSVPLCVCLPLEDYHEGDMKFDINDFTQKNGVLYALYAEAKTSRVEPSPSYDEDAAREMLSQDFPEPLDERAHRPNIVVVMNESFADYDLIGDAGFTEDVLPVLHSLEGNNCLKTQALVSVYGGYTCNSEWEFLTGGSLAFLPVACIPYNQVVDHETYSLATSLRANGYHTTAFHPYNGEEWHRARDYPLMGFDEFVTGEDLTEDKGEVPEGADPSLWFGDLEYLRGFVSDAEDYREVRRILEEKPDGEPEFLFNVTIQNHSDYEYEDFTANEFLPGAQPSVNQYLTLLHESDRALGELIDFLEDYDEDTILLLFGDHQPSLSIPWQSLYANPEDKIALRESSYTVPCLFWANYDVTWENPGTVSLNCLSAVLKEFAGLPADPWDRFRTEVRKTYPAFNAFGALKPDGSFVPLSEACASDELKRYRDLQFYLMAG